MFAAALASARPALFSLLTFELLVPITSVSRIFDKPPALCCITHERTYLLSPSRKEERRRKENKGERRKECPIEAILNNHSLKLF